MSYSQSNPFNPPSPLDNNPKCPLVVLLDTSSSMLQVKENGKRGIDLLNEGLKHFQAVLLADKTASKRYEVAIVSFNSEVKLVTPFTKARNFIAPVLQASDFTHMGEAVEYGWEIAKDKISEYQNTGIPCYQPVMFMITDGSPQYSNEREDVDKAKIKTLEIADSIKDLDSKGRLTFFVIGIEGADYGFLERITPCSRRNEEFERLQKLGQADFKALFIWITVTANALTNSIANSAKEFRIPIL
jgi:uncharacterized protein YegL